MKYTYGCRQPKVDIRDYKLKISKSAGQALPIKFQLDNLPQIKDQSDINSCVAHATSSALEYFADNKITLSTNFIYGMESIICNETEPGMYLVDACQIVKDYGDVLYEDCPGNTEVPECNTIAQFAYANKAKMEKASKYKIYSYYACTSNDDIKYALMKYGPVLGSIYWYDKGYFKDKEATIEFNTVSDGGYHCIMIYGWDETGWLIQNSWGKDFGNNGRFRLPYKYPIEEARAIIDMPDENDDALIKTNGFAAHKIVYKPINKILNFFKKIFN